MPSQHRWWSLKNPGGHDCATVTPQRVHRELRAVRQEKLVRNNFDASVLHPLPKRERSISLTRTFTDTRTPASKQTCPAVLSSAQPLRPKYADGGGHGHREDGNNARRQGQRRRRPHMAQDQHTVLVAGEVLTCLTTWLMFN